MLKHASKRLLVLLPAVWLIASVVFLLSKSVPGSASETQFEMAAQSANSRAKAAAYEKAYRQMLHKTGQDLPLFYFRISTFAEPDTLFRITSEEDRTALQQFILSYGNWPAISDYYLSLKQLKAAAQQANISQEDLKKIENQVEKLLKDPDPDQTIQAFRFLHAFGAAAKNSELQNALSKTQSNFKNVVDTATPAMNYWPRLHWFGFENQYHRWFKKLLQGNLGFSSRDSRPVTAVVAEAFGVTIWLALSAFLLSALLAPEIGMVLSRKSSGNWRTLMLQFFYGLESVPLFLIALLVLALGSWLGMLDAFPEEVSKVLVVFCLVLVNLPYLTSQAYGSLQTELQQQYILTARAKGLPDKKVLRRHAFRNSLLPVITLLSDFFPALLAGTVVLEVIFSVPGLGRLLVSSVLARDYEVITAIVLLTGFVKMVSHLLADLLYTLTDPRIRR